MVKSDLSTEPEVGIIVLNWNGYQDTKRCLQSFKNIEYSNYRIYVIDNGSSDDSGERIADEFESCTVIQSETNQGFAGGNNVGIQRALNDNMEYILLLNNDTVVENGFLTELVRTMTNHKDAAIVGGIIEHIDNNEIWYAGGEMHPALVKADRITEVIEDEPYETDHVVGALMLISSDFVQKHGALDDSYFFGIEDTEISIRARKNGRRVLVNPNARIKHDVSSTAGEGSPFKHYHATRNRLQFAESHLSFPHRLFFYGFFATSRLFRFLQWLPDNADLIKATMNGTLDYIFNRPYKRPRDF